MNAERMLSVFRQKPAVIDEAQAVPLEACIGEISFQNAVFCYTKSRCQAPCEPALNAVTFHRKPGTNTPLVRESGGGKSTVFRLLFRYGNLLEESFSMAATYGISVSTRSAVISARYHKIRCSSTTL